MNRGRLGKRESPKARKPISPKARGPMGGPKQKKKKIKKKKK
jgi:hypothetical protein